MLGKEIKFVFNKKKILVEKCEIHGKCLNVALKLNESFSKINQRSPLPKSSIILCLSKHQKNLSSNS